MVSKIAFKIRPATLADLDQIADAHLDSIRSIGSQYYSAEVVYDWAAMVRRDIYINAMASGELFFIAKSGKDVLGFSSHRIDEAVHGVSVYVRAKVARLGIGSALLRIAEASAIQSGAESIQIDASLPAIDFYRMHGFQEISRGDHQLASGRSMPCVFMRKSFR